MASAATVDTSAASSDLQLENVLHKSRSPYVRAHMNNPVAWQEWGPEAIALAKKHNRLLFLSVGYAACHWCHVMERESFENHKVADILNKYFIPIKVDREERPDVDRIYMNYVQATSGRGGWPMSVFITPDLEPVFGGTYFPGPDSPMAASHLSFLGLLERIRHVWESEPERCLTSAKAVTEKLREFAQEGTLVTSKPEGEGAEDLELELMEDAFEHFDRRYDATCGGFGHAPKFPTPANLSFLLWLGQSTGSVNDVVGPEECARAQEMVLNTLRNMNKGGIRDHVGNGFARYSVTRDWSLPHFEKMLYDQGQLLDVYLSAWLASGEPGMLDAVHDIATYLTTPPLAAPDGGFYSSEDADSYYQKGDHEKREGAFYVWTKHEIRTILGEDADIFAKYYNVRDFGNVDPENDAQEELTNQNVLNIVTTTETISKDTGLSLEQVEALLARGRQKLLEHRDKERPRPDLDDKIVVAWNGLAVSGLARTASAISNVDNARADTYRAAAAKAVDFVRQNLIDESNHHMRRVFREGPGDAPAFADDYAFFIQGLIDLYQSTFDDGYLQLADQLQKTQNDLFWDAEGGGFFSTQKDQPDMILRLKDGMDNAEPSTNGISASNLYRLGSLLEDEDYTNMARKTCEAFSTEIAQHPFLFPSMLPSVAASRLGVKSLVISGDSTEVDEALSKSRLLLKQNTTVARIGGSAKSAFLLERNPLLKSFDAGKPRVQVCERGTCRDTFDISDMQKLLQDNG